MSSTIEDARAELRDIIRLRSFSEGTERKLASGRTSNFYFNMKPTMMHPRGSALIARLIIERLSGTSVDLVGGLEMGAVPLAASVATASAATDTPLAAFFIRKAAKDHGTMGTIEGLAPDETLNGRSVCILEDVTTTGGSALKAVESMRAAGANVELVLTVVDRQEGAKENFDDAGLPFDSLLTAAEFQSA